MGKSRAEVYKDKRRLINLIGNEPKTLGDLLERFYRKEKISNADKKYVRQLLNELKSDKVISTKRQRGTDYYFLKFDERIAYQDIKNQIPCDGIFGVVSDTHLCSKYCAEDELQEFYDELKDAGVKNVFHAGDVVDGWMLYRGQLDDVKVFGAEEQARYFADHFPKRKGMKTYFITGNHEAHHLKKTGVDIGNMIDDLRPDLIYLAPMYARIELEDGAEIDLVHDSRKNKAYALSYPAQTRQRDTPPSVRADMSILGHRHTMLYMYYGDEHIFEAGCFQRPSPYHLRKGIHGMVGGWIIEYKTDPDMYNKFKKVKTEAIRYDL